MANPIKRHSRSRKNTRRAHDFLTPVQASACPKCHEPKLSHRVCPNCGSYKGREVIPIEKAS